MAECVQVAVSNATFHFDKLYSYSVPAHLQDRVFVGSMVLVPFGRGAAARMGVVLGLDAPEAAGKNDLLRGKNKVEWNCRHMQGAQQIKKQKLPHKKRTAPFPERYT